MNQNLNESQLTRFKEGSLRELWHISFPLILAFLSCNMMIFVDRLVLSRYSTAALNAASAAGIVWAIFQLGTIAIAAIAETYSAQYNGARKYHLVSAPVWQMIWFSLATIFLFFPLAWFSGPWLLPKYELETLTLPYYQWILYLGFNFPLVVALSAFFVAIGKVKLVLFVTLLGNILNIGLDLLLVFGIEGLIPAMATKGAAIATGASQFLQAIILFFVFLNKKHRDKYATSNFRFNIKLFVKCFKTGLPNSLGHVFEMSAWTVATHIIISVSSTYLIIATIGQTLYLLFAFAMEGLQKAVITIAANLIGKKSWSKVIKTWKSGIKLIFIFFLIVSPLFLFYQKPITSLFLASDVSSSLRPEIHFYLKLTCIAIWVYLLVDGITWITAGILTASGDTYFIMWMNAISAWLFAIVPIYIFIGKMKLSPAYYWFILVGYGVLNASCFYWRLKVEKWRSIQLISD